jgi:hypothetical protein
MLSDSYLSRPGSITLHEPLIYVHLFLLLRPLKAYPSRPRVYIITMDPYLLTPDGDDIVDELLASLIIQDAETDETKFDKSHDHRN